jgi:membrane-associated protease RseP (regulator of RpoE activity)
MLVLGIVLFALGLLFSIAWHELGHFTTARWFGVRVPEFMVGFGPTVFARQRGETSFGIKAIPLGGYIRMIGMVPPARGELIGRSRRSGPFQGLIDDVRADSARDIMPGDEERQFWTRKPWQRIVVMFAGPFMNLILAAVLFVIVLMGFGIPTSQPVVQAVSECVVPASQATPDGRCPPGAPLTPAAQAGFRSNDRIVSFEGRTFDTWEDLQLAIRDARGTVPVVVERAQPGGGVQTLTLYPKLIQTQLLDLDSAQAGQPRYVTGSFLGLTPMQPVMRQTPAQVLDYTGTMFSNVVTSIAALPHKVPALFGAVFLGQQRDPAGPVSVVGVSVIGGEVLASDKPVATELATMLQLLAAVNISLFLLNLLPILPLDGGHILPALWEAGKKRLARLRGRPDPGPVDMAKLMPIAYGFAILIMLYGGLVIVADIVNPIKFSL